MLVQVQSWTQISPKGLFLCPGSKPTAWLAPGLERRSHVALLQTSRGRACLVDLEQREQIYLATGDQVQSWTQTVYRRATARFFVYVQEVIKLLYSRLGFKDRVM